VTDGSKIKVHRIVAHRSRIRRSTRRQIERQDAGSVHGCLACVYGVCTVKNAPRADQLRHLQFACGWRDAKVESIVMPRGASPGWVGEPTSDVAGPAVLNAYFAATGKQFRSVPLERTRNISFD